MGLDPDATGLLVNGFALGLDPDATATDLLGSGFVSIFFSFLCPKEAIEG